MNVRKSDRLQKFQTSEALLLRWIVAAMLCFAMPGLAQSQGSGFVVTDTIFTPPAYVDGSLMATLYRPANLNGAAVVAVHELGTARTTLIPWCDTLASNGYVVLNIDYPDPVNAGAVFPSPVDAVKTGIQFLRKSADDFGISSSRIGAFGRSLGAGLIAQAILDENDDSTFAIQTGISDHVDFAALLYGIYDTKNFLVSNLPITQFLDSYFQDDTVVEDAFTPVLHAANITAPIFLAHGTADETLMYQQSQEFHDSLSAHGKINTFIEYPGEPHLFETNLASTAFTLVGLPVKDSVLAFFSANSGGGASVTSETESGVLYLWPSIVSQILHVRISPSIYSAEFIVLDPLGRTIIDRQITQANFDLDVSNISNGCYFCELHSAGQVRSGKIIVDH